MIFYMFDLDIQTGDTVVGDARHGLGSAHDQNTQNFDKFDKAFGQVKSCSHCY